MKKRKGQIEIVLPVYFLMIVIILIACTLQVDQFNATSTYVEDALAASNLASGVINIKEYGLTHQVVIAEADQAFQIYQRALKANMQLDDQWESNNKLAISGKVEVLDYIIYNVWDQDVEIIAFGQNPYRTVVTGGLGTIAAPNGKIIKYTSVYSKITFPVDAIFGIRATAVKDELIDIVGGNP